MLSLMQRTLPLPPLNSAENDSNALFNVVIVYEDFETGKQAKKTYDFLVDNLGPDCHLTHQMWKFDVLGVSKLREIAVKDAVNADIIIISSHGDEPPPAVIAWIESWLQDGVSALALVALFDRSESDNPQLRATREFLSGVATRAGIGFFAQPAGPPAITLADEAFTSPTHSRPGTISALSGMVQRDLGIPRWGINE